MPTLECHKCGKIWTYKGQALRATCPSCLAKVKVSSTGGVLKEIDKISNGFAYLLRSDGQVSDQVMKQLEKLRQAVEEEMRRIQAENRSDRNEEEDSS